jgi:acetyl esterase
MPPPLAETPTGWRSQGDSAGANLAAGVSLLARNQGSPALTHQILLCPWVDLSPASEQTDSFGHFGNGLWLSTTGIRWYRSHYLQGFDRPEDPRVSPLLAPRFSGLPAALVITSEFDVLADQGRVYAQRLESAGVEVVHSCYPGTLHDFAVLPGLFSTAWRAIDQITASLRAAFSVRTALRA